MTGDMKLSVAEKIFITDRMIQGDKETKLDYLFSILDSDEQEYPLVSWMRINSANLDWIDNIYAMAERILNLPSYPMDPKDVQGFENEMNALANRIIGNI